MEHVIATGRGRVPAGIRRELGGMDAEAIPRVHLLADRGTHRALARQAADRRAHGVALLQQPDHAPAADEARPAGHQYRSLSAHRRFSMGYFAISSSDPRNLRLE